MSEETAEQKELKRKEHLEKLKARIESGELKDLSKVSKKDKEELVKMGVELPAEAPKTETKTDTDNEEGKKPSPKSDSVVPKGFVKVKSLVNMTCYDGTNMVQGKDALLTQDEYERLKKDKRKLFVQE